MHRQSILMLTAAAIFTAGGLNRVSSQSAGMDVDRDARPAVAHLLRTESVDTFLGKLRGLDAAICDLVGQALRNNWGGGLATPILHLPGRTTESVETVRWALRRQLEDRAVPRLRRALDDTDPCVRQTAARLFDRVDNRRLAIEELTKALRSSNSATQQAAVLAFGFMEDRSTVPTLTLRLSSTDAAMRQVVAWSLGRIEHVDAIPALVEALGDLDAGVRGNAAWALGQVESDRAVRPLAAALRDGEMSVRLNAALALGRIENADAIPALSDVLAQDQDAEVRKAAAWALGRIE